MKRYLAIPEGWYNILPDLPFPLDPPLDPQTKEPVEAQALERIFPRALVEQEFAPDSQITIPHVVREIYSTWRPTPLRRARRLEKFLNTKAEIYYKYEGTSAVGSHKLNTALAQAYYNEKEGIRKIITETGAGQWGSALALAGFLLHLPVEVFMVRISAEQKPQRLQLMRVLGAKVTSSPSEKTGFGRKILSLDPKCSGSLGIAISEALEQILQDENARYALGSVLNHVLLHQTVIGLEAKSELAGLDRYPDVILACHGGGSNFAGISFPFLKDKLRGEKKLRAIAVEPEACPSLTQGRFAYDNGDTAGFTPLLKMYTLGRDFVPPPLHAGGLRYHGASPIVSALLKHGFIEAQAVSVAETKTASRLFMESEGIIPAPESSHALAQLSRMAPDLEKGKVVLLNLSGHGLFDLNFYED